MAEQNLWEHIERKLESKRDFVFLNLQTNLQRYNDPITRTFSISRVKLRLRVKLISIT